MKKKTTTKALIVKKSSLRFTLDSAVYIYLRVTHGMISDKFELWFLSTSEVGLNNRILK